MTDRKISESNSFGFPILSMYHSHLGSKSPDSFICSLRSFGSAFFGISLVHPLLEMISPGALSSRETGFGYPPTAFEILSRNHLL